jgi:hypothetical protein
MVWSVIDLVLVGLLIASLSPVSIQRTEAGGRTTHPSTIIMIGRPHNTLKYVIPNLTHNPLQNLWRSQICGTAYLLCVDFVLKPTWTVHRFISDVISGICLRQKYVCPWVGLPSRGFVHTKMAQSPPVASVVGLRSCFDLNSSYRTFHCRPTGTR